MAVVRRFLRLYGHPSWTKTFTAMVTGPKAVRKNGLKIAMAKLLWQSLARFKVRALGQEHEAGTCCLVANFPAILDTLRAHS